MSILDLHLRQRLANVLQWRLERVKAGDAASGPDAGPGGDTQSARPARTAFVLLGGGSRGAAQAGALTALLDAGVIPDIIVAISAGAWNGAYLAVDPTPERALGLERAWLDTTSHDIVGAWPWNPALQVVRRRLSLYDSAGMRRVASHYVAGLDFADLRVPLRIVATDLIAGRPHIFAEGSLLSAVIASSSVPGIFPPVASEHELLVDGGMNEWAGCMAALDLGATRICLLACGSQIPATRKPRSFMQVIERSMDVSLHDSFDRTIFALRASGVDVLPVFPTTPECSFLDFNHAADLIACGHAAGLRALALGWNPPRGAWIPDAKPTPEAESVAVAEQSA
ncbi:MAG TPA: patatin-like phospholipase family protein [Ktedonobacterales bacterium]